MIEITQVYERYTSHSNDAERGDVLHRCLFGEHCRPEQLVAADFSLDDYSVSIDRSVPNYTYYRLYPIEIGSCTKCGGIGEVNSPTYDDPAKIVECRSCTN